MCPVVLDQVGTHCSRDFGPILHTDLLQIFQISWLLLGNTDFQLPPKIFYWVQVWSLARPLQDLVMFLTEPPLLCVSGRCYAGRPSHDSSSMFLLKEGGSGQDLMIHGPIHPHLLNMVQSSFPLCRK